MQMALLFLRNEKSAAEVIKKFNKFSLLMQSLKLLALMSQRGLKSQRQGFEKLSSNSKI